MKLKSTMDVTLVINGKMWDIETVTYATVKIAYIKRTGWAMYHDEVKLKGKDYKNDIMQHAINTIKSYDIHH